MTGALHVRGKSRQNEPARAASGRFLAFDSRPPGPFGPAEKIQVSRRLVPPWWLQGTELKAKVCFFNWTPFRCSPGLNRRLKQVLPPREFNNPRPRNDLRLSSFLRKWSVLSNLECLFTISQEWGTYLLSATAWIADYRWWAARINWFYRKILPTSSKAE